jgi:hypothetical protein
MALYSLLLSDAKLFKERRRARFRISNSTMRFTDRIVDRELDHFFCIVYHIQIDAFTIRNREKPGHYSRLLLSYAAIYCLRSHDAVFFTHNVSLDGLNMCLV